MASSRKMNSRSRSHFLPLLAMFVLVTCFQGRECTSQQPPLIREVGQNVTFNCTMSSRKELHFFYFQRGDKDFVNGLHSQHPILSFWQNTRVERHEMHVLVHMKNLNVSHNGNYTCLFMYKGNMVDPDKSNKQLIVKANYTKPLALITKKGADFWSVTCISFGGYPQVRMRWNMPENCSSRTCKVLNNSEETDPSTMLFNSSSTAVFNCSNGEMKYLSCSVDGVHSKVFEVCVNGPSKPPSGSMPAIIATVIIVPLCFALLAFLIYKKIQRGNGVFRCVYFPAEGRGHPTQESSRSSEEVALNGVETK